MERRRQPAGQSSWKRLLLTGAWRSELFSLGPVGEQVLVFSRSGPGLGGARGMEGPMFKEALLSGLRDLQDAESGASLDAVS